MSAAGVLWKLQMKRWLTRKGFLAVVAVASLPVLLSAAWLGTHQADINAVGIDLPSDIQAGDTVTLTATIRNEGRVTPDPFNASLEVGFVNAAGILTPDPGGSVTETIEGLAPGEERTLSLEWTAAPGLRWSAVVVDRQDVVAELDEYDNLQAQAVWVAYPEPSAADAPRPPPAVAAAGGDNDTVSLAITDLVVPDVDLDALRQADGSVAPVTVTATARNLGNEDVTGATVTLRAGQVSGGSFTGAAQLVETVNLTAGASETFEIQWTPSPGVRWAAATIVPPQSNNETDVEDNYVAESVVVQPPRPENESPIEPSERQTLKGFYANVLSLLQIRVVIPLIALFFAVGVLAESERSGELVYLLTRPVPRWSIPLLRFGSAFLVAGLAVAIGAILSFFMLFLAPGGDIGYLTGPLITSLAALAVYLAGFVLIGVAVDRPYLWGLGWVLGWETAAPLLVPWVRNLTLSHHVGRLFEALRPVDESFPSGVTPEPVSSVATTLAVILVALLLGAAYVMGRREFRLD